ncbi:MAG: hypothetical protein HQ541_14655 [Mariniphaga sp.]|nr:hypothetical protein [Mariniphaga sp.]
MKKFVILLMAIALIAGCSDSVLDDDLMLKKAKKTAVWNVPDDFATIQMAIDDPDVEDGAVIQVANGEHAGALVTKAVTIKGSGKTVINDGPLLTSYMPCGTIVLDCGFFFTGAGAGSGASISNLTFDGVAFPVFSRGADDISVKKCTMLNPIQGVTNWAGNNWVIDHNVITDLRSANGGGIGVIIADNSGGIVENNVVSHNKISGTLSVAECDGGNYAGSGIVLYADFRGSNTGAEEIKNNKVLYNKISLESDNPEVVDVVAFELTDSRNDAILDPQVLLDNKIGFNDFRGTTIQVALTPENLDEWNIISRNLGDNRGHGVHPSLFK